MSNFEKLLAIVQDKPWEKSKNNAHGKSNILLLREHLRRMLIWKKHLAIDNQNIWYLNIVKTISSDFELPKDHAKYIVKSVLTIEMEAICNNALQWEYLKISSPNLANEFNLPEPYEASILMFERGGSFLIDPPFIEISSGKAFISRYTYNKFQPENLIKPIVELDIKKLDEIDSNFSDNRPHPYIELPL